MFSSLLDVVTAQDPAGDATTVSLLNAQKAAEAKRLADWEVTAGARPTVADWRPVNRGHGVSQTRLPEPPHSERPGRGRPVEGPVARPQARLVDAPRGLRVSDATRAELAPVRGLGTPGLGASLGTAGGALAN